MAVTIAADKVFGLKRDLHLPAHGHHHEDSLHDWLLYCHMLFITVADYLGLKLVYK